MLPWMIVVGVVAFLGGFCLGTFALGRWVRSKNDSYDPFWLLLEGERTQRQLRYLERGELDPLHHSLVRKLDQVTKNLAELLREQQSRRSAPEVPAELSRFLAAQQTCPRVRPSMKPEFRRAMQTPDPLTAEAQAFLTSLVQHGARAG